MKPLIGTEIDASTVISMIFYPFFINFVIVLDNVLVAQKYLAFSVFCITRIRNGITYCKKSKKMTTNLINPCFILSIVSKISIQLIFKI